MTKILVFDIETGLRPCLRFSAGKQWVQAGDFLLPTHFLGFSWRWVGEEETHRLFLHDINKRAVKKKDDRKLVKKLWELLDEADAVVSYNGNGFDLKIFNASCLQYGLTPPSPYKSIDLYQTVRQRFRLDNKKLDTVAKMLGFDGKNPMCADDWVACYNNDLKAFEKMAVYCDKDVDLTHDVYIKLLPFIKNHINMSVSTGDTVCTKCSSHNLKDGGWTIPYANGKQYKRVICQDCGNHCVDKNEFKGGNNQKTLVNG